ncbi:MAG: hypothetical protein L0Y58_04320 [Verrucomicrobia subdivision 3 bacterium]|nr:hypothetical protein [Limisphaerales bacterium]
MKAKVFSIVLREVSAGNSASARLEEEINNFLEARPNITLAATHMNTVTLPPERNAMRGTEGAEPSVIIFSTLFYSE